jgi:hypothetical protein
MARSEAWYDEPEFLQNPLSKTRWMRDVRGFDYSESEPPAVPSGPSLPYPREFTPEETERMLDEWREPPQEPAVARRPADLEPTVGDDLYGRSLHGSTRFTRDEVCRGYRRL